MTVRLKWMNRVIGDSIRIYRAEEAFGVGSLPTPLATIDAAAQTYEDATVLADVPYFYAVAVTSGSRVALSALITASSISAAD